MRSDKLSHTLLPKRIALPIFASDALSSVAYAPDEILLTLSVGGAAFYAYSWKIALAVVAVMLVVVASYRQNVHAYPSGGGDYEVATVNLGPKFGLVVASALMVDYVLTVAVSVSSGVQNLGSAWGFADKHPVTVAVVLIVILTAMNLRGIREAGLLFAIPTYLFMGTVIAMVIWGFVRIFIFGNTLNAASSPHDGYHVTPTKSFAGLAFTFLMVRTFSSGCAALTGVEAISNGVPAFQKPKSKNAATTLLMLGVLAIAMLVGIVTLARMTHVQLVADSPNKPAALQVPVLPQLGHVVFGSFHPAFYLLITVTALILVLAANTAFNGFPVLGSILAQDRYLPRQLHTRGDRLAFSNGIIFLAAFAVVLIAAYKAQTTHLIQLYIVGVFVSFTLSQTGMLRHWNRLLRTERDTQKRRRMYRSRVINGIGLVMTGFVLVLVVATKFLAGAWISIVAMVVIYMIMLAIRRHYDHVATELAPVDDSPLMLPARNHAVVLVSKLHLPTMRALAYAQGTRPDTLTAVTVNVDDADTRRVQAEWTARDIPVPLTIIDSPYREITKPIIDFVKELKSDSPRDVVTVFIPEYVVGKWFENLLHNQSALRLKGRLLYEPGVMVVSVPWQLHSSELKNLNRMDRGLALQTPLRGPRGPRVPKAVVKPEEPVAK